MRKQLRYGMVGGSLDAFIGGVHRLAIGFENTNQLVAGCFSRNHEANQACGDYYQLESGRIYSDYEAMAQVESKREDGIDFVVIVTPNYVHYEVAKAFIKNGIHVVCEKPLCIQVEEAVELEVLAKQHQVFFGVTYTYSGYTMVKYAKELVASGAIGKIINVNAEYLQEWLIDDVGDGDLSTKKLSMWRKDPSLAGGSNCVGDIGTHIEHTVAYITGLRLEKVVAVLDRFSQPLDLNANMLVTFDNGAHGVFSSSQVCCGHANGLIVRIFGTQGAIEWQQEHPDVLWVTKKGQPTERHVRGMGYITGEAARLNRLPSGHPEGLIVAFANFYKNFTSGLLKTINGESLEIGDLDYPTVSDGVEGVRFIHAVLESDRQGGIWVPIER